MTAPAPVPWLERVPAYVPGRPAPASGLALAANEAEACSERVPAALAQPLAWNRYPDPLATPLRRALAAKHGVDPEQILVSKVPAGQIPVETLKRFSYQIRMPAAKRLNLPPPLPMLAYAELIHTDAVPSQ